MVMGLRNCGFLSLVVGRAFLVVSFALATSSPPLPTSPPHKACKMSSNSIHFGPFWSALVQFGRLLASRGVLGGVGVGRGKGRSVREENITSFSGPKNFKAMTATDVTGFDAIFSTGFFASFSRF